MLWATCSARAYQFSGAAPDDYTAGLQFFIESALDEPADWSFRAVAPDRRMPDTPWQRFCFAVSHRDESLKAEAWREARAAYTPVAIELLKRGIEQTLKCVGPE